MRKAVRAIVVRNDELLVMKRDKFGHVYYTLVGGGIDFGETPEQALYREVAEETGIEIKNPFLVYVEEVEAPYGTQYNYVCEYVGGEPVLHPDSQEAQIAKLGKNLHTPQWIKIVDLEKLPFRSANLKAHLLRDLKGSFPDVVETFQSTATIA
ncbi:MAG: mutT/nudix family protein [Candidatus Saccharibacteria bacterium]|nr:mutT/nudix family protein [Candidatus Saccharibacteria bacterium]